MPPPRRPRQSDVWGQVGFYTSLGFIIPAAVVAGYIVGWFLDEKLRTTPAIAIIGGLLGAAGGIFEVVQLLTRAEKNADRNHSSGGPGPG